MVKTFPNDFEKEKGEFLFFNAKEVGEEGGGGGGSGIAASTKLTEVRQSTF